MGTGVLVLVGALAIWAGPAAAVVGTACRYEVAVSAAFVLEGTVRCDAGVTELLTMNSRADRHTKLAFDGGAGRYRVDLAAMTASARRLGEAFRIGNSVIVNGGTWLPYPDTIDGRPVALEVTVTVAPGMSMASAMADAEGRIRIDADTLFAAGYTVFGRLRRHSLPFATVDGEPGQVLVVFLDGTFTLGDAALLTWVRQSVTATVNFWGGLSEPLVLLAVLPRSGRYGVLFGRVMRGGGLSVALMVGERVDARALAEDWVLVHEFVHVGHPHIKGDPWFAEGLATYLEPIIRARMGRLGPAQVWAGFRRRLPQGATVMAATGLAGGGFVGTYWGGALWMLLADVGLRQATAGRAGLEHCLRAVRQDGGAARRVISVGEMIAACDRALGVDVMTRLYARHAGSVHPVALGRLWQDLGVRPVDAMTVLDDGAPLAWLRRSIVDGSMPVVAEPTENGDPHVRP